ncbi:MAG: ABC transporter ATP-binding protein [Defluviitaleaceae bacterium]|nr:ABC transporter ATP-binding protein [Defluviitaleaceae bacterium]
MLNIENLTLQYGTVTALQGISLKIAPGEICVLIGPSGCGKSSLLNILAGNIKNYEGTVTLNDQAIDNRKKTIGMVSQSYGLLPWRTVYGNIILPLKIKKLPVPNYRQKIKDTTERLGIQDLMERYPNSLSGGQKQRAALAKTFILDPLDLLLMDEPFSALDAITREESQELFVDVWTERRPLTIFVTHSIDEAIVLGKKIVILGTAPGKIIEIIDNPAFGKKDVRTTKQFLDISTRIRALVKKEWKK